MRMYKLPGGTEPLVTFSIDPYVAPTPARPHVRTLPSPSTVPPGPLTRLCWLQSNQAMLAQGRQEEILRSHLERLGCVVELGTTLGSIQQREDHVEVQVTKRNDDKDVIETIRCHWLIGTDGARSAFLSWIIYRIGADIL